MINMVSKEQYDDFENNLGINPMTTTLAMFSPKKILVESSTMIFIISFMLLDIVILAFKGPEMQPMESMMALLLLFATFLIAGRQYASFR